MCRVINIQTTKIKNNIFSKKKCKEKKNLKNYKKNGDKRKNCDK
jgi:hypothetical protein